jgi:phage terminase large subunit-like protein
MNLSNAEVQQLNDFNNLLQFRATEQYRLLINSKYRFNCMFSGNQGGKTCSGGRHYVDRIMGLHPIAERNSDYFVCKHDHTQAILTAPDGSFEGRGRCKVCDEPLELYCEPDYLRVYRFASETLPGVAGGEVREVRNTQYPEVKKWLPPFLIKRDINSRYPVLTLKDINGGGDILIEFVSYSQNLQAVAGQQRKGLWCDEEPPYDFMEEQYPRLFAANGDVLFTMTAANKISWLYDEYYEKADIIYRTATVVDAEIVKQELGEQEPVEKRNTGKDICVIQFASDDNPTLKPEAIEGLFENVDDPSTLIRRRYGGFAQASGRVLKSFRQDIHVVREKTWFPEGIPADWTHARGIDYHQRVDWHFNAVCLSPEDELFIYLEKKLDPGNLTTYEMSEKIASLCGEYIHYILNKIDPLANTMQTNTGTTTIQDLNRYFSELKREDRGTGGYWTPWDTKSIRGREQLRLRLKNSIKCGKPFNNLVKTEKGLTYLPTIWILDSCPQTAQYLRMWRHEENKDRDASATKDENENVQQKWSHYPMVIEGILKEQSFTPKIGKRMLRDRNTSKQRYYTVRH